MNSPAEVLTRVQVLRFVAATLVVLGHARHEATKALGIEGTTPWSFAPTALFAGGVDIFFVISGFIMFTISAHEFGRGGASARFLVRRLTRIVPAYWLFTLLMAVVAWGLSHKVNGTPPGPGEILASLLFLPHHDAQGTLYPVLMLGWTLNFEMLFYAVFALGLCLPRPAGLALIAALVGTLALVGWMWPLQAAPFAFWAQPIVLEFLFGVLLGWLRQRGWRLPGGAGWLLVLAGFAALILVGHFGASEPLDPARVLWMGLPALAICAAATLVPQDPHPGRWERAGAAAGDASYALYLSHPFVLGAVGVAWRLGGPQVPEAFVLVAYAACVAVALLFYRAVERPMTRVLNARLGVGRGARDPLSLSTAKGVAR
ncbi:acyltransferase family protein [Azohydromonas caseinilytica]|uniref:Acyltransferase n=1 Tax=Azohydromonas caseinilytica TaxID=2728836 RepID=A0A848FEC4_9BURK|nr:acyltransferase [Azohydromonas caseinilytica]NML17774.1 acyltransferase [Azohydromonas caseinilytica]